MKTTYKIAKAIMSNKAYAVFARCPKTGDWHTQATFKTKNEARRFIAAKEALNEIN